MHAAEEREEEVGAVEICVAEEDGEEDGALEEQGDEVGDVEMCEKEVQSEDESAGEKGKPDSIEPDGRAGHSSLMVSGVGVLLGEERRAVLYGDACGCAGGEAGGEAGEEVGSEVGGEEKSIC